MLTRVYVGTHPISVYTSLTYVCISLSRVCVCLSRVCVHLSLDCMPARRPAKTPQPYAPKHTNSRHAYGSLASALTSQPNATTDDFSTIAQEV